MKLEDEPKKNQYTKNSTRKQVKFQIPMCYCRFFMVKNAINIHWVFFSESKIAIIVGSHSLQSNDIVYLQGANNDGKISAFNVMNNSCSLEAPFCNSTLTLDVLDLRLADDGTDCKQSLTIVDGTRSVTLTCANNINYTVYSVPSQTNYITITFQNSMTVQGGHFWLEFSGKCEVVITSEEK